MPSGPSKATRPVFPTPPQGYDPVDESAFRREVERFMEAISETVIDLSSLPQHASEHACGASDELHHDALCGLADDDHTQYHTDARHDARAVSTHSDITITAIAADEVLQWSGSAWINRTLAEAGISAVGHTHPASDIDSGTFADARIAQSNVTQHQAALSIAASQITAGSAARGDLLFYNGTNWVNQNVFDWDTVAAVYHIKSKVDASLIVEADSDDATETDNPLIELRQDGGTVSAFFEIESSNVAVLRNAWADATAHLDLRVNHASAYVRTHTTGLGIQIQAGRLDFSETPATNTPIISMLDAGGHVHQFEASDIDGIALQVQTNPASSDPIFAIESSGGAERLRVDHDGFIRIRNRGLLLTNAASATKANSEFQVEVSTAGKAKIRYEDTLVFEITATDEMKMNKSCELWLGASQQDEGVGGINLIRHALWEGSLLAGESIAKGFCVELDDRGSGVRWYQTNSSDLDGRPPKLLGVAMEAGTSGNAMKVALFGEVCFVSEYALGGTTGEALYVPTTDGDPTTSAPTSGGVSVIGFQVNADCIFIRPDYIGEF